MCPRPSEEMSVDQHILAVVVVCGLYGELVSLRPGFGSIKTQITGGPRLRPLLLLWGDSSNHNTTTVQGKAFAN